MRVSAFALVLAVTGCRPEAMSVVPAELRSALQQRAGRYPLKDVVVFGRDSALLIFQDSTYTGDAGRAGTWMFGPPVTVAEADNCPPEKVLGRQIARVFWRGLGTRLGLQQVVVQVGGTKGMDQFSRISMFYYPVQLEGLWAGDPK